MHDSSSHGKHALQTVAERSMVRVKSHTAVLTAMPPSAAQGRRMAWSSRPNPDSLGRYMNAMRARQAERLVDGNAVVRQVRGREMSIDIIWHPLASKHVCLRGMYLGT